VLRPFPRTEFTGVVRVGRIQDYAIHALSNILILRLAERINSLVSLRVNLLDKEVPGECGAFSFSSKYERGSQEVQNHP
jgi:hypothetical protein